MKTLIVYYSYSGITEKASTVFADALRKKGSTVEVQRLVPRKEITSFFAQCMAARKGVRADLQKPPISDASPYDIIIIASPVWAFAPVPAVNTFLDGINGLSGKKVVSLLTSGSGLGVSKCFSIMRQILQSKGASTIVEVNIPNRKMNDNAFIAAAIEKSEA